MTRKLLKTLGILCFMVLLSTSVRLRAQATVFSTDFSASAGTGYTTTNGPLGNSTAWSFLRGGGDHGARINSGMLTMTNDATGSYNSSNWSLVHTSASNFASPYSTVLNNNPGVVTWTFNMRQIRSNPSGPASGYYANAFILAGTSNTTATTGSGYAVTYGQSGTTDPIRIIRYTAGLRTSTNVLTTPNSSDISTSYMSVKVVFDPGTGLWQLYARIDGNSAFQDPAAGSFSLVGSGVNTASTATSLPLMGTFWNAGTNSKQTAFFDNIKVTVATPVINSISPTSKIANTGAFTLTVNGANFLQSSFIKWNGVNRVTTYVSPTQLTASIPASDITTAGSAVITVGSGGAISNSKIFTIDPAATPSISASTSALTEFVSTTGTASATQSFTVTGASLTSDVTVTAPANFEVRTNATTTFSDAVVLTRSGTTLTGQPVTVQVRVKGTAPAGQYAGDINLTTTNGATKQVDVAATVLAAEPANSSTGLTFTNVNSVSFKANWLSGTGTGTNHLVVVRAANAVNATPIDGETYSAATAFGAGAEIGTGNYVVYNGTGTSVTITGLMPATTYHVSIFEFNGGSEVQNYKITSPLTGSRITANAPLGWQITSVDTEFKIDFDNSVEGINNGAYNGAGYSPLPEEGELNSNGFVMSNYTTGSTTFGLESDEDSPQFGNGISEGGVTDGGIYAFEVAPDNRAFGFQPSTDGYGTGSTTIRMQNQTGTTITSLNVGYTTYIYNDESGVQSYNFSHSATNTTYISVNEFNTNSTPGADVAPAWKAHYRVTTLNGLNIAPGGYYYFRFNNQNVSGTAFDEMALDDIMVVANPTNQLVSFQGAAETFILAGNGKLSGNTSVDGMLAFAGGKVVIGANTLTINGPVTNGAAGGLRGSASSNLVVTGAISRDLSFDQTTTGVTNLFNNFSISTTLASTTTVLNNFAVNGTLFTETMQTLNLGTNTLTGTLNTITNNGIVKTQNTTPTPVTAGKTWGGTGTFDLSAPASAQTLVGGTYNNVLVSTTGGAVVNAAVTVNGVLHLPNANPSAILGALATGTNVLTMGPNAVNTGIGDVSGIVRRNTIVANTLYTMGHANTAISFPPVGVLPSTMSLKLTLGVAPSLKPNSILRTYDFIQTGGSGTKAIIKAHYLDSELNANIESKLVDWVIIPGALQGQQIVEQGRSNYSTTENWVELGNVNVVAFSSTFNNRFLTLANSQVATSTWNGSESTSWTTAANWTPNATPGDDTLVIIPNANLTPNDPYLNPLVTIGKLVMETGAILFNDPAGSTLTITGSTGAWINNGTFNAGTGTVVFNTSAVEGVVSDATIAGNTTFNNITIPSGKILRPLTDNVIKISGTLTKTGSFIAGTVSNTVEYTGSNQVVVMPDGVSAAYHNLIINGTGAIVPNMLNVLGDLITNATVNFAGTTVTLAGGSELLNIVAGSVSPQFNNLVINRSSGKVLLGHNITVGGILTMTSGLLDIGSYNLTLGTAPVAGSFSETNMIVADFTGVVRKPYTGTGSYTFPIGELRSDPRYSPITVNMTAGTFNNGYVGVNVSDAVHPDNYSNAAQLSRYWNVTQTGITGAVATISATYTAGDVEGEGTLAAAQLKGTFNVVSNPWVKFGDLSSNTLFAQNVALAADQTNAFTGITSATLIANITGEGTFCANEVVTLTAEVSAGDPPFTYSWSNDLGSAATATPSTATPGTVTYTLTVRDANGIASVDTADVTVTPAAVAGTLTGDQTICEGLADAITLTGYTGNIIRWERSTSTAFLNPAFITSASATLTGAEMGNLNATRYFRAVVQNGSCQEVYSNAIAVTVSSTTWNGSVWSSGEPTASTAAIFTANYTATNDINACSIQVTNDAIVIIQPGVDVTLSGRITVTSGSFTLADDAHLIQINDVQNIGDITVKQKSSQLFRFDYTVWSSPVANQNLFSFSPDTQDDRFYQYALNGAGQEAYIRVDPFGNSFNIGKGYLIRMPHLLSLSNPNYAAYIANTYSFAYDASFTGVPNNGNISVPISAQAQRYSMVGNPYPSPINVHAFFDANAGVLDASAGIYFWRKRNNVAATSYATLTKDAYVYNQAIGGGQEWDSFFNDSDETKWVINTAQGFYVRSKAGVANPVLSFNNAMRRDVHNNQFFRNGQAGDLKSRYWLNLTNATRFSQAAVVYSNTATLGIDYGRDGIIMTEGEMSIYSLADENKLSIQARPAFGSSDVVPLGFTTSEEGTYTLTLHRFDGVFSEGQDIYLKDNQSGLFHNLKDGNYTFTAPAGIDESRFEIVYMTSSLGVDIPAISSNEVVVYKNDKALTITSGNAVMNTITVFDTRGRVIYTASNVNASTFKIDQLAAEQQMLIVNIATDKGTVSKKVVY